MKEQQILLMVRRRELLAETKVLLKEHARLNGEIERLLSHQNIIYSSVQELSNELQDVSVEISGIEAAGFEKTES